MLSLLNKDASQTQDEKDERIKQYIDEINTGERGSPNAPHDSGKEWRSSVINAIAGGYLVKPQVSDKCWALIPTDTTTTTLQYIFDLYNYPHICDITELKSWFDKEFNDTKLELPTIAHEDYDHSEFDNVVSDRILLNRKNFLEEPKIIQILGANQYQDPIYNIINEQERRRHHERERTLHMNATANAMEEIDLGTAHQTASNTNSRSVRQLICDKFLTTSQSSTPPTPSEPNKTKRCFHIFGFGK